MDDPTTVGPGSNPGVSNRTESHGITLIPGQELAQIDAAMNRLRHRLVMAKRHMERAAIEKDRDHYDYRAAEYGFYDEMLIVGEELAKDYWRESNPATKGGTNGAKARLERFLGEVQL